MSGDTETTSLVISSAAFITSSPSNTDSGPRRKQRQIFPGEGGRGQRRNLGDVVGGRHLDYIHSLKGQTGEAAQDCLRLPREQAAAFGRPGTRREGRIKHVDIEAQIDRRVADHLANPLGGGLWTALVHGLGEQDL